MSGRKIQPSKMLLLRQVHQGHIKEMLDQKFFIIDEDPIAKVRVYGTVLEKRDISPPDKRRFISLRIDDGTDTIGLTVWSYPKNEYGDPIEMVEKVKIGDIIEVVGKVREYKDELFISPRSVDVKDEGIDWEIYRRTQLIQTLMEDYPLLPEGQLNLEPMNNPVSDEDEIIYNEE